MRPELFLEWFLMELQNSAGCDKACPAGFQSTINNSRHPISRARSAREMGSNAELKFYLNDFTAEASSSFTSKTV